MPSVPFSSRTPRDGSPGPLQGVRVIEVASELGAYCGKLLADLGADVILVEPPGGSELRMLPPLVDGVPDPARSLSFIYLHGGKRYVTLDLHAPEGQRALLALVQDADVLIEGAKPSFMRGIGLDYASCSQRNPALVYASISPFGADGPYAELESTDIVHLAMGGLLSLAGYPDGPPIAPHGQQSHYAGSLFGAVAIMACLIRAEATGLGEHIDVSAQEAITMALENAVQFVELEGIVRARDAGVHRQAGSGVFEAADGHFYMLASGVAANRFWINFVQWLLDEGVAGAQALQQEQWLDAKYRATPEAKAIFATIFEPFARANTRAALYEAAKRHRVPLSSIASPADVLRSEQLAHRMFFVEKRHPLDGRAMRFPGAPYRLSETPWQAGAVPAQAGTHNDEILGRWSHADGVSASRAERAAA